MQRSLAIICDMLLLIRQAQSQILTDMKGNSTMNGLYIAQPHREVSRQPFIPESVQQLHNQLLQVRPLGEESGYVTEKQRENEAGGCTRYEPDARAHWMLANE